MVCSNGTAALHMAARALDLGPGRKIIVPAITFLATASAPHTRQAGDHQVPLRALAAIARIHKMKIVDDACHTFGATYVAKDGTASKIGANATV